MKKGVTNNRKPNNMSIAIKVTLKTMTTILTKMNKKKMMFFYCGSIDIKIKVMNEINLMLQRKIIIILSLCYA
jgi:hypothetical protein